MAENDSNAVDAGFVERLERAQTEAIANSTWRPPPLDVEPRVDLRWWQVIQVDGLGRHLIGDTGWEGRVSGTVQAWDPASRCARTKSGRIYHLCGRPGLTADGEYVRQRWLGREGSPSYRDVTEEFLPASEEVER